MGIRRMTSVLELAVSVLIVVGLVLAINAALCCKNKNRRRS